MLGARFTRLIAAVAIVGLLVPSTANAWFGDFFDGGASGQAVYEAMAIHPQSVLGPDGATYVVYQGKNLDAYIVRLTAEDEWEGPYLVGVNPLTVGRNPDDTHGAPSIVIDQLGYLHVFWGSHLSRLQHARSAQPLSIDEWVGNQATVPHNSTYSQPFVRDDGAIVLSYRLDQDWNGYTRGSWMLAELADHGSRFETATAIVSGDDDITWYGNTRQGADGRVHGVFLGKARYGDQFERENVYYLRSGPDRVWRDVCDRPVASENPSIGVTVADLESTATASLVYGAEGESQNQAVVAVDGSGVPGLLFATGAGFGPDTYRWVYSGWDGSLWTTETVASTDHSFDSSTLEFTDEGVEAFLTIGGTEGTGIYTDVSEDRGGDIVRFFRDDEGWSQEETVAVAQPGTNTLYNDPQMVFGHDGAPRLLYGEWNNDGANFVHKVFLWGDDGYHGREFFPSIQRIAGDDRYDVAAAVSRASFPINADTAIVVNGAVFTDALAGAPLANAYNAPILLTNTSALPTETAAEIARLRCTSVLVLGGTASVSTAVEQALKKTGSVKTVERIGGKDRYEVAARVATKLAEKRGRKPGAAFLVSGEAFADGLAAGSVAAARSMPVLLTKRSELPRYTTDALESLDVSSTYIVGGPATVASELETYLPDPYRISGRDRYSVAANLAELALDGGAGLPPTFDTDRILIASGEVFPDALAGSAWAARIRGPLLLTRSQLLALPSDSFLRRRGHQVLDCYLLGGERSVSTEVADGVADALRERQAD